MARSDKLGEFELFVLAAVIRLQGEAYGAAVRRDISDRTGRAPTVGAIYTTLARMEDKGIVTSALDDRASERAGRSKRFFTVTPLGQDVFDGATRSLGNMMEGLVDWQGQQ